MSSTGSENSSSDWLTIEDFLDSRYRAANALEKVDLFLGEFKQLADVRSLRLDVDLSSSLGKDAPSKPASLS
jgi:hypothetical protein